MSSFGKLFELDLSKEKSVFTPATDYCASNLIPIDCMERVSCESLWPSRPEGKIPTIPTLRRGLLGVARFPRWVEAKQPMAVKKTSFPEMEGSDSIVSTVEYGISTSIGYGVSSFVSNTTYSSQQINKAVTKVIKGEFEKIKDVKVEDASLTCDTPLEVFNKEVNRLSGMDNDLFTYEVKVTNILCNLKIDDDSKHEADDDMGYDPSDVAFIEWLASKIFNYKTMERYTMKALWIYWIRGDDEVELTDEESSDDEDEC
ncbi:hypothetical protein Tco_1241737 [Tanacetum coccineum]